MSNLVFLHHCYIVLRSRSKVGVASCDRAIGIFNTEQACSAITGLGVCG